MCVPCFFTVSTAEVGVIEKWGKYSRLVQPGLNVVVCPMEQMVGRLSFRVQQLDVRVETKTLDNVFLTAVVSVQYQILKEKVYDGELFQSLFRDLTLTPLTGVLCTHLLL
jgi:regulator of protease activity HflC (stomatin/prohibitin superfamily)